MYQHYAGLYDRMFFEILTQIIFSDILKQIIVSEGRWDRTKKRKYYVYWFPTT